MPSTQSLRRKIKSVKSTSKLTRAMQMVAASKMAKAAAQTTNARPYSYEAWQMINSLAGASLTHPLMIKKTGSKRLVVVLTSNRGLAGGFNAQIIKKTVKEISSDTKIVSVGKKATRYFARFHPKELVADFTTSDTFVESKDVVALTNFIKSEFLKNNCDQVFIAYNRMDSTIKQTPVIERVLPIERQGGDGTTPPSSLDLLVEPDATSVINQIVPRILLAKIYQIFLESTASEHAARMIAMKNATDNARDIIDDLTLTYQSVRQAGITREIIEISAGANALNS